MPRPPLPSIPALVGADHRGYEFQRRELRKTLVALGRLPEPEPEVVDDCECPIDWKEVYRLKKQGQRSEAIRLVQEGLAQRETVDGPDSLVVADTLERLADLHNPKPRQEIELRERAMAIYQKHLEISDRRIGAAARGLALNYSALDEIEEASRWALMAVESHQAASDRNLLLAITLDHLAELRRRADATDEALEYYRLSAEMWKSVRGEDSHEHLDARQQAAFCHLDLQNYEVAEHELLELVEHHSRLDDPESWSPRFTWALLERLYEETGRSEAARRAHEQVRTY